MSSSFEDLIKKFGVPKIVIPNTPKIKYKSKGSIIVSNDPQIDAADEIYQQRFKYGDAEFLAVRSRIETWFSNKEILLEHLQAQNLKPVEIVYRYKGRRTWDYSTNSWKESKVAIATERDIEPLSREDLLEAVEEKRVLWVCGWSSMGDKYVDFHICPPRFLPNDAGYHFLFDAPCRLTDRMLVGMGEHFEWEEEFFNCYSDYFTCPFFPDE